MEGGEAIPRPHGQLLSRPAELGSAGKLRDPGVAQSVPLWLPTPWPGPSAPAWVSHRTWGCRFLPEQVSDLCPHRLGPLVPICVPPGEGRAGRAASHPRLMTPLLHGASATCTHRRESYRGQAGRATGRKGTVCPMQLSHTLQGQA